MGKGSYQLSGELVLAIKVEKLLFPLKISYLINQPFLVCRNSNSVSGRVGADLIRP
jgi:hypothetical protein